MKMGIREFTKWMNFDEDRGITEEDIRELISRDLIPTETGPDGQILIVNDENSFREHDQKRRLAAQEKVRQDMESRRQPAPVISTETDIPGLDWEKEGFTSRQAMEAYLRAIRSSQARVYDPDHRRKHYEEREQIEQERRRKKIRELEEEKRKKEKERK
jgi:hypothetical protein